jgi:hypothetical protein
VKANTTVKVLSATCPHCGARPWGNCRDHLGNATVAHKARVRAAHVLAENKLTRRLRLAEGTREDAVSEEGGAR